MKRSHAPSILAKSPYSPMNTISPQLSGVKFISYKSPLTNVTNKFFPPKAHKSAEYTVKISKKSDECYSPITTLQKPFQIPMSNFNGTPRFSMLGIRRDASKTCLYDHNQDDALILFSPPEISQNNKIKFENSNTLPVHVVVDPLMSKVLRPHQREGVKFMWDRMTQYETNLINETMNCIEKDNTTNTNDLKMDIITNSKCDEQTANKFYGCIMADDMGLGKTLQCVTLVWTMLTQNPLPYERSVVDLVIIVTPSSLVKNWQKEFSKWLGDRIKVLVAEGTREKIEKELRFFVAQQQIPFKVKQIGNLNSNSCKSTTMRMINRKIASYPVLVISYETFRIHSEIFSASFNTNHTKVLDDQKNDINAENKENTNNTLSKTNNIFSVSSNKINVEELGLRRLLICDEGHRLKNCENQTYKALDACNAKRRILLSGTPIQNDLLEYFSLIHFVDSGLLGSALEFKKRFENPILKGRDAYATSAEREKSAQKLQEMLEIVNQCIIRRTSALLTKYLPLKVEMVVCCQMSSLQKVLYQKIISNAKQNNSSANLKMSTTVLATITLLKKLCNHPELIYDKCIKGEDDVLQGCAKLYPSGFSNQHFSPDLSGKTALLDRLLQRIKSTTPDKVVLVSNYTQTLDMFEKLCRLRGYSFVRLDGTCTIQKRAKMVETFNDKGAGNIKNTDEHKPKLSYAEKKKLIMKDRINMAKKRRNRSSKDGNESSDNQSLSDSSSDHDYTLPNDVNAKRRSLPNNRNLNSSNYNSNTVTNNAVKNALSSMDNKATNSSDVFVFMLSSKAGGCGLNLIGANRLIMFDPDWNPANDSQAMARVWRDGQASSHCFLYRFLATGSIEEKIFQRQSHKKSLSDSVIDSATTANKQDPKSLNIDESSYNHHFSRDELRELFTFSPDPNLLSDTHEKLKCKRCQIIQLPHNINKAIPDKIDNLDNPENSLTLKANAPEIKKILVTQLKPPPPNADCSSPILDWFHAADRKSLQPCKDVCFVSAAFGVFDNNCLSSDDNFDVNLDVKRLVTFVFYQFSQSDGSTNTAAIKNDEYLKEKDLQHEEDI